MKERLIYFKERYDLGLLKNKEIKALSIVERALSLSSNCYVAFSGGKDSTVVLDLVRRINQEVVAIYGDDEFILTETKDFLNTIDNLLMFKKENKHCEWLVTNKGIDESGVLENYDVTFLGLRAEEDSNRKKYFKRYGVFYKTKKGKWLVNPIAYWTVEDVWSYIFGRNLKYNKAYDIMFEKGLRLREMRIGPFANRRAISYGQLANLKKCFPIDYRRFMKKFPEARRYV